MNNFAYWKKGFRDGVPIMLAYLAVSFTFGIAAQHALTPLQGAVMSALNYTSAGQFAALGLIVSGATCLEMALTQLVINLRYCLMSCTLSQKLAPETPLRHRLLLACGVTDEIFGVTACVEGALSPFYSYGLMSAAMPGWVLGTVLGMVSQNLLPARAVSALGIAIYGMFVAIIVPPARQDKKLAGIILLAAAASFVLERLSGVIPLSSGMRIIVITVAVAALAATLFPVGQQEQEREQRPDGEAAYSGGAR